jgi:transposase
VRAFYAAFRGRVIVGLEASGYSPWFERLLEELGYEVWLGHATEIRRRGSLATEKRSARRRTHFGFNAP